MQRQVSYRIQGTQTELRYTARRVTSMGNPRGWRVSVHRREAGEKWRLFEGPRFRGYLTSEEAIRSIMERQEIQGRLDPISYEAERVLLGEAGTAELFRLREEECAGGPPAERDARNVVVAAAASTPRRVCGNTLPLLDAERAAKEKAR